MVALIRPTNLPENKSSSSHSHLRLVVDNGSVRPGFARNQRRVGSSTKSAPVQSRAHSNSTGLLSLAVESRQVVAIAAAMALLVFGFLLSVRFVQGAPDPSISLSQSELTQSGPSRPAGYSDVRVVTAEPGDSMWSIAIDLGAADNPQPAVDALIAANGGESVYVGQQIIVPEQLVG